MENTERYGTVVPNTPLTLDTKASIAYFLQETENKIKMDVYTSKEDLLKDIRNFDTLMEKENKDQNLEMQDYAKEVAKLLTLFDEKNKNKGPDYSQLTEVKTADGRTMSNLNTGEGNITLAQQGNRSIQDEMNDLYNMSATNDLNTIRPNTVEDNFSLLQNHVKEEIPFEELSATSRPVDNPNFIATPKMDALVAYAENNNIEMDFTGDGLGRDKDGNIYEVIMSNDGQFTITKVNTTTFTEAGPVTEEAKTVKVITPDDFKGGIKEPQNGSLNSQFLEYLIVRSTLANGMYSKAYLDILNESNIPADLRNAYENAVEMHIINSNQKSINESEKDTRMEQSNTPILEKPKTLVFKKPETPNTQNRGGFVNAFLLTIVTVLFGALCMAYMFFGILG